MKHTPRLLVVWLVLIGCALHAHAERGAAAGPPNIVFILADDLGISDINAYAHRFTGVPHDQQYYETPHLDQLVRGGLAFSQAYAMQLCSPTRASILTGRYGFRYGFTTATPGVVRTWYNQGQAAPDGIPAQDALYWGDNIPIAQALINGKTRVALPNGYPGDAGDNPMTLPEALPDYDRAFIGKWHVGGHGSAGYQPDDFGFDAISYFDAGGSPYFNWRNLWEQRAKPFPKMNQPELLMGKSGGDLGHDYLTNELTEHAVKYLEERAQADDGKPFFLYFNHFAVHTPLQGPADRVAYYENKPTRGWNNQANAHYAAMVESLDQSVGRVMQTLARTGLDDNTLVIFFSDNGGVTYAGNPQTTHNTPFLGGKAMLFEGGIRVPLIVWAKRGVPSAWCDVPVHCTDLFATVLDYASITIDQSHDLDGQSIRPLIEDPTNAQGRYTRDTMIWHYPFNVIVINPIDGKQLTPHSAIRKGDHKLIYDWHGRLHLYNLVDDPFEKRNLRYERPELAMQLFKELNDWLDTNIAPRYLPTLNPAYQPIDESRDHPFVDLRKKYLGEDRAIQASTDPLP